MKGANIENTENELKSALESLDWSFYISFESTNEDIVNSQDGIYNSVILVGRFS